MTCSRCGAEDSTFWYPYGFGMASIPSYADRTIDRAQYFMLCDRCQTEFIIFMKSGKGHYRPYGHKEAEE